MKKSFLLLGTACGSFLALSGGAIAQTDTNSATPILGISKSASAATAAAKAPVKIPLKSTYTVSVISKQVIENTSPATTAQDILAREPSIYVTNNGPSGVNQKVTFRAFSDGEFSETYDGIPLNDPFTAGVVSQADNDNNTLITKNDFDSIDIYRGINNPATNSYNSLGGTINFNSRKPTDNFNGEAGAGFGSFDSFNYHVTLNTGLVAGVKQLFSFERNTSNGWTQNDKNANSNLFYSFEAPLNNSKTKIYGSFIYSQSAGDVNQLTPVALLDQFGTSYQFPTSSYYKQNNSTNFLAIGGIAQEITPDLSLDLKAFVGENDYVRNSFSTKTFGIYSLVDGSHRPYHLYAYYTNTFGVQPSLTWNLPHNTIQIGSNLTFSHEHSREYFSSTSPVVPNPQADGSGNDFWNEHMLRTEGSAYIQDTISLMDDRLKIIPGAKYLWAETKNNDQAAYYYSIPGSVSNYAHYSSPTLSASYELFTGLDAYASYGQNIKFPDITAYYSNDSQTGTNNVTVNVPVTAQPEHVTDYEAGIRYVSGSLALGANYYREDFSNIFNSFTDPVTGLSTTRNGGKEAYDGVELQAGDSIPSPFAAIPGDFSGYINASYNHGIYASNFTDQASGSAVTKGQPLGNVPDYLVSLGGAWTNGQYFVGVDAHYIGKTYLNLANTNVSSSYRQGAYFITNLSLSDTVPVKLGIVKALKFSLNVDNLFNVRYYAQSDINVDSNNQNYKEGIVGAPLGVYGNITAKF
ncbi:MAG: TonB-dependent receptor [Acidocella sp.]|nr:TonB-dependent receptor [Acidocella sp.]